MTKLTSFEYRMGRILAVGSYLDRFAELECEFDQENETGDSRVLVRFQCNLPFIINFE